MDGKLRTDYYSVTEIPGLEATREQLERIYQRYRFARSFAKGKDVLEIACGSGMGLGFLAKSARSVMGGDIDRRNIDIAVKTYKGREKINIKTMDAHGLPLSDESVDLVILFEAIYYLHSPENFVKEAERVLRPGGVLMICSVNRDWDDFHPSPYTYRYFSVPELYGLLRDSFSEVDIYAGFSTLSKGLKDKAVSLIKRTALKFNLIPGSLKARTRLKRIFMGNLEMLPTELHEDADGYAQPEKIEHGKPSTAHKIIYAVAKKKARILE